MSEDALLEVEQLSHPRVRWLYWVAYQIDPKAHNTFDANADVHFSCFSANKDDKENIENIN